MHKKEEGPIIPAPMMTMLCLSFPNIMQRLESQPSLWAWGDSRGWQHFRSRVPPIPKRQKIFSANHRPAFFSKKSRGGGRGATSPSASLSCNQAVDRGVDRPRWALQRSTSSPPRRSRGRWRQTQTIFPTSLSTKQTSPRTARTTRTNNRTSSCSPRTRRASTLASQSPNRLPSPLQTTASSMTALRSATCECTSARRSRSRYRTSFICVADGVEKPRQYAFTYTDTETLHKEIEEFFSYKDVILLREGMRVFEENNSTRICPKHRVWN
jgi:hypothetical protein